MDLDELAAPEVKSEHDLLASLYPEEMVRFVSLPQHLGTIFVFDLFLLFLFKFTKGWREAKVDPNRKFRGITKIEWLIERLFAVVLFSCLLLQIYYKAKILPKYAAHMLAPCHAVSCIYLYILLQPNPVKASQVWNVMIYYSFYPMLALISMDGTDFIFPGMCETSYAQHIVLAILPFYLLFTNRLPLEDKKRGKFLQRSVLEAVFFCWNIQLPVALLTKINVNYMLWPPPGGVTDFLGGNWYQFRFVVFFLSLHVAAGFGFPALVNLIKPILSFILSFVIPSTTSAPSKSKTKKN